MRLNVKTKTREDYIYLPATEKELQKICDKFSIDNNMSASVTIQKDYDDNRLTKILEDKEVNLNELNFLTRKLVDLDTEYDVETFYAVANTIHEPKLKDLINLSYNTHCYHLVTDFKDLNTLGRTLYLNENGAASKEFLDNLNGAEYIDDIMKNNKLISASANGLIYANKNKPQEHYNGQTFPLHFHTSPLITTELAFADRKEYLFLPCEQSAIDKAMERLGVSSLDRVGVSIYEDNVPENVMEIGESTDLSELNHFASILEKVGDKELEYLSKLVEFTKVDNIADLETLTNSMFEIETHLNIKNCEQLGFNMIMHSGRFDVDENLEDYINFEQYGEDKLQSEKGIFTDKGYLSYIGYNQNMIEMLNRKLGMELEYEAYSETLKLYMPLEITTYDEEDDYGRYRKTDYEGSISHTEFRGQGDELNELLQDYQSDYETDRKLMEYYNESDAVNAKVKSLHFEIEEHDRGLFGVAVAKLNAPLNNEELSKLTDFAIGQSSDGIGEGFEQQDYEIDGRNINIHLWQSDNNWYIKTDEEMGFTEPEQSFEIGGMA